MRVISVPGSGADDGNTFLLRVCTAPVPQVIVAIVLLAVLPWAVYRAAGNYTCDIPEFVVNGRYVLEHGTRQPNTSLDRYLPSVDVACIVLGIVPLPLLAVIYYLMNVGTWLGLLYVLQQGLLAHIPALDRSRAVMAAGMLALPIAIDGFLIGAFHTLMLWLMITGLNAATRDQWRKGGVLLGVAVWLKLLPAVGVVYLLLRRKWRAAALSVCVAVTLDVALSLAAYGWHGAIDEHLVWAFGGAAGSYDRLMQSETPVDEDRITNQSLPVVLRRLLTERSGFPQLSIADLPPAALHVATGAMLLALAAGVFLFVDRNGRPPAPAAVSAEIALVALCTIWFSPVVWSYHFTAALPALAVVMAQSQSELRKRAVAAAWVAGMALFAVPLARAAGNLLWPSLFIGAAVVWCAPANRAAVAHDS